MVTSNPTQPTVRRGPPARGSARRRQRAAGRGAGLDVGPCGVLSCADGAEGWRGCYSSSGAPVKVGGDYPYAPV